MLSFWEKQSLLNYDIIIIGSGIVGLSTAISIKEKSPQKRVMVLERAVLPTGASTKNAGFACIGSLTEIIDDLESMSKDEVLQLVNLRLKGLKKLRSRLGDSNIEYTENGSWELIRNEPNEIAAVNRIDEIDEMLKPVLGGNAFECYKYNEKQAEFGFNPQNVEYLIKNNYEGELDTGKMMRCLIDLCLSKGIEIKTGCNVVKVEEIANDVNVVVSNPFLKGDMIFKAAQVGICTNAFTGALYPELDIQPGRGQVLVTKPLSQIPFKGIYHFDKGYYYFRKLGNRVLFGGGRNMDFKTEQTTDFSANEKIRTDLVDKLQKIILPGKDFAIEDWWTGIMAFGASKFPILKRQSKGISLGVRMGGMGVAIGSEIGEQLAEIMLNGF